MSDTPNPFIEAMDRTTAAVERLHRWLRRLVIVWLVAAVVAGFLYWSSSDTAKADTYLTCLRAASTEAEMSACAL